MYGPSFRVNNIEACCSVFKASIAWEQKPKTETCHCCPYRQSFARLVTPIMSSTRKKENRMLTQSIKRHESDFALELHQIKLWLSPFHVCKEADE